MTTEELNQLIETFQGMYGVEDIPMTGKVVQKFFPSMDVLHSSDNVTFVISQHIAPKLAEDWLKSSMMDIKKHGLQAYAQIKER